MTAVVAAVSCSKMNEMDPEGFVITADQVTDAVTAIPDRADADLAGIYAFQARFCLPAVTGPYTMISVIRQSVCSRTATARM